MGKIFLSKSKIKSNKQCKKRLWLESHRPNLAVWEKSDKKYFSLGRDIEKIAKDQFSPSLEISSKKNDDKISKTYSSFNEKNILEASFEFDGVIIQVDILSKNSDGSWRAIEIKSGSSLKDDYIDDVIIQYWTICKSQKINLKSIEIWFISKSATGEKDIFEKVDLTEKVEQSEHLFLKWLNDAKETFFFKEEPQVGIGTHCYTPNGCPFQSYCWKNVDDPKSVLNLPSFSSRFKAYNQGILTIDHPEFKNIFQEYIDKNPVVIESLQKNKLVVDLEKMRDILEGWGKDLSFFDFETLSVPIPIIKNTHPYQQTVVQYSLHTYRDSILKHKEFLHESLENPFVILVPKMISDLTDAGSIVSYNKTFETTRIGELIKKSTAAEQIKLLEDINKRFVDLLDVVKECIYHPLFKGSYSLKIVSPTLLGLENGGYTDSEIKSGADIATYYVQMLLEQDPVKKQKIKDDLLKYCKYDTLNLFLLYKWMLELIKQDIIE